MRVVVVGAMGGIGSEVFRLATEMGHACYAIGRHDMQPDVKADAVVACNGSHHERYAWADTYWAGTLAVEQYAPRIAITTCGGGVGGVPARDVPTDYQGAKAALAVWTERMALEHPERQFFCVAPGLTATKMTGYKGADPRIPAAFIVKLLSGKYGHLSGSLLAARRDDLDAMKPMKLRRVECP